MATEEMKLWLPPTFISPLDETLYQSAVNFPDEFPYEFDSFTPNNALNSPVESTRSTNEAESSSDEEEFSASLTQLHHSRPIHVPPPTMDLPEMKKWASAGSPQSIVGGFGALSGRSSLSSNKSPTGHSHLPSPPTASCNADNCTLDLINEAAGQVARLKMNFEATNYGQNICSLNCLKKCCSGSVIPSGKPNFISSPVQPNATLPSNRTIQQIYSSMAQHQQEARSINDFLRLEKLCRANLAQQKEHIRQLERGIEFVGLRASHTWSSTQSPQVPLHCRRLNHPPLFHCPASSLSSLCLSSVKRESSGTGVFLPRGYGNPPPPRKKSGYPPVLSPEIVRAISMTSNINNNNNNPARAQLHGVLSSSMDPLDHEILLPQEWTY